MEIALDHGLASLSKKYDCGGRIGPPNIDANEERLNGVSNRKISCSLIALSV